MGSTSSNYAASLKGRTDGWNSASTSINESALDYNYMTRHPSLSIVFVTITSCTIVWGEIGNILVIGAVATNKKLKKSTGNIFLVNLALADLCITSVVEPFNIIGVLKGPRFYLNRISLCHAMAVFCTVSCMCSITSIAAVALNRCFAICKNSYYHVIFSRRLTVLYCFGLWIYCLLLDLPSLFGWGANTFALKEMGCTYDRLSSYSHRLFGATFGLLIPIIIVFVSYVKLFIYVQSSKEELIRLTGRDSVVSKGRLRKLVNRHRKIWNDDIRLAFTLFAAFVVFLLCWSPYLIAVFFDFYDDWPKQYYVVTVMLGHLNSSLNHVIYAICNKRFRRGYLSFLKKLRLIKKGVSFGNGSSTARANPAEWSPRTVPCIEMNSL